MKEQRLWSGVGTGGHALLDAGGIIIPSGSVRCCALRGLQPCVADAVGRRLHRKRPLQLRRPPTTTGGSSACGRQWGHSATRIGGNIPGCIQATPLRLVGEVLNSGVAGLIHAAAHPPQPLHHLRSGRRS